MLNQTSLRTDCNSELPLPFSGHIQEQHELNITGS